MYLGARSAGWVKTYNLRVKLTQNVHFEQALPAAGESVFEAPQYVEPGGYRRQESDPQFYLDDMLPPDCTHGLVFSANWVRDHKVAIGTYTIGGSDAWFMLVPVGKKSDEIRAETYMYGAKNKCYYDPSNHAAGDLSRLATEKVGHTTLAYRFNSPTAVFYRKWAYSNGYLLVGTVGTDNDAESQRLLEKSFKYAALRADDSYLGTEFQQ
jgi:hypothetical protein